MSEDLDSEVRGLLMERKGDWKRIADVSNVSYSWISKFVNGHIPNPGFATLRDLQKSLKTDTKLVA
jgi:transcriptional regulator with XRE-family HTH domain